MSGSPVALRAGVIALFSQLTLQLLWHGWLLPGSRAALALAVLPLLLPVWVALRNLRRGVLIAGILSLFYFCHSIANLWTDPASRPLAALETALSLLIIGASWWDARGYRRAPK